MRIAGTRNLSGLPRPAPAAGESYYQAQRLERFSVSPQARENWNRYQRWLDSGCREIDSALLPVKAYISPISQCNFRCTMCAVSDFPRGKRAEPMELDRFLRRLDELPTIVEFSPTGLSEVLMTNQATLLSMLREVRRRKIWTLLVTNGSLLHQRHWIKRLVELDLNEIGVSLDGTSKEVFESIRRGSNFDRVIDNVRLLVDAMAAAGIDDRLKVQFVLQEANASEIRGLVPFVAELGIRSVAISVDVFDWGSPRWRENLRDIQADLSIDALESAVQDGVNYGVRVGIVSVNQKFEAHSDRSKRCHWPFIGTVISSDDRFVPCCHIYNPDHFEITHSLGSSASAQDVWMSSSYRTFRENHLLGEIPDACRSCYQFATEDVTTTAVSLGRRTGASARQETP